MGYPSSASNYIEREYEHTKFLLEIISYNTQKWVVCVDLKMVNFLLGQQSGYTKFPCFLRLLDSGDRAKHYTKIIGPHVKK